MPLLPKQQLKRRSCLCLRCDLHSTVSTIDDPMGQVNHENECLVSSATARTWQCASLGTVRIFACRVIPRVISESEGSTVQHVSTMFHTYVSLSNHSNHYPIDSSTEVQYHFHNHRCEEVIDSFSGLLPPVPSSHMWDAKPQSSTRK